ncbi:MAG: hypothetical protein AAGB32_03505 [Pseudomonadota bacterium]
MSLEISPELFAKDALRVELSPKAKAQRVTHEVRTSKVFDIQKLIEKISAGLAENYRISFNGRRAMNGKDTIKLDKAVFDLRTEEGAQAFFKKRKILAKLNHPVFVIMDRPTRVFQRAAHSEVQYGQAIVSNNDGYTGLSFEIINAPRSIPREGLGPHYWGAMIYAIDFVDFGEALAKDDDREPDRFTVRMTIGSQGTSRVEQSLLYAKAKLAPQLPPRRQSKAANDAQGVLAL